MNALKLLAVGVVVCVLGVARAEEKPDYAKMIVGKWEVTKADEGTLPKGTIIEFTKDGKFLAKEKEGDKDAIFDGTYKMDGDKFEVKIGDTAHMITITKMTDTEMHTKNPEGKVIEVTKKK
jgi:uncharacterized protein (TIGR03066 family)